jgi:hypothetical protein
MIYLLLLILITSQIFLFHLNKDRIKKYWDIPKNSIILKPIPKQIKTEDVDDTEDLLSNVIKSAKDENWKHEFKYGIWSNNGYHIILKSPDKLIEIESIIRIYDQPRIIKFNIKSGDENLNIEGIKYYNQIIIFLWDFILQKHIDQNSEEYNEIKSKIKRINKNLKALNRNKILDQLLKKD